jgi:hypothetical protein
MGETAEEIIDIAPIKPKIPEGYKEVKQSPNRAVLSRKELPWMGEAIAAVVPLVRIDRENGKSFYYGSAIKGRLAEVAAQMNEEQSAHANALLHRRIQQALDGDPAGIHTVHHAKTEDPIRYVKSKDGTRVYFTQDTDKNGQEVYIRIAACHSKGFEQKVLQELTTQNARELKRTLIAR